MLVKLNMSLFC